MMPSPYSRPSPIAPKSARLQRIRAQRARIDRLSSTEDFDVVALQGRLSALSMDNLQKPSSSYTSSRSVRGSSQRDDESLFDRAFKKYQRSSPYARSPASSKASSRQSSPELDCAVKRKSTRDMVDSLIPQLASIAMDTPKQSPPPITSFHGFSPVDWSLPSQRHVVEEDDDDAEDDEISVDYHY